MMTQVLAMSDNQLSLAIPIIALGGGFLVALVAIITSAVQKIAQTKAREESRREIAAYVAEGTISPDDATKMLNAGSLAGHIDQFKQKLKL
jgi:hypothetical protein